MAYRNTAPVLPAHLRTAPTLLFARLRLNDAARHCRYTAWQWTVRRRMRCVVAWFAALQAVATVTRRICNAYAFARLRRRAARCAARWRRTPPRLTSAHSRLLFTGCRHCRPDTPPTPIKCNRRLREHCRADLTATRQPCVSLALPRQQAACLTVTTATHTRLVAACRCIPYGCSVRVRNNMPATR